MNVKLRKLIKSDRKMGRLVFVGVLLFVFLSSMSGLIVNATQNSGQGNGYSYPGVYGYGYGYWTEFQPTMSIKYNSCARSCSIAEGTTITITATFGSAPASNPDVKVTLGDTVDLGYTVMAGSGTTYTKSYTVGDVSENTTATVSIQTLGGLGNTPTAENPTFTVVADVSSGGSASSSGGGGGGGGAIVPTAPSTAPTPETVPATGATTTVVSNPTFIPAPSTTVDKAAEGEGVEHYVALTSKLPEGDAWRNVHFIAYGTDASAKMSVRDRKGVIGDYNDIYGRVPSSDQDWEDISLILTSKKPSQRQIETEKQALVDFVKVYKRVPDFTNIYDEWAVYYIAYNIRNVVRNIDSEKAAIGTFRSVYGYVPSTSHHWSIMRAIAYTGASR